LSPRLRTLLVWLALLVALLGAVHWLRDAESELPMLAQADFAAAVAEERVLDVQLTPEALLVMLDDGLQYQVPGMLAPELAAKLGEQEVAVWAAPPEESGLDGALVWLLGLLALLGAFYFFLRRMGAGGVNLMALRRSRHRKHEGSEVRFADVGGLEDAKAQLADVVDYLAHPERWRAAGVRLPRGVLLEGPPGCGKTLLARAVAGETKASFFSVSASEFVEMFVGVGAARMRDLFERAAKEAPAVVFIDELDAIGRRRGSGHGYVNDEREHTLNQLLVNLDGFERLGHMVVMAATNRSDILDTALLRPGRFDRRITFPPLGREARLRVLELHARGKPLAAGVSLAALADASEGATGADLEGLVNEAGLLAVRRASAVGGNPEIRQEDLAAALASGARAPSGGFDPVDTMLVESTTRLTQSTGTARVRLTLFEGVVLEGELIWADATFVKLRTGASGAVTIVPKGQIKTLEPMSPGE
jgi:cell division protease FtsH